jgi:hypothetical protein
MAIAILLVLTLVGCASPGAPLPPSLKLPKPVEDLTATRKGNQVTLSWTPPTRTSDDENIRETGKTLVCRAMSNAPMSQCGAPVATLNDAQVEHWTKDSMVSRRDYTDTIPESAMQQDPLGFATYAVEDQNNRGRSAGLSKQVRVPVAPTLPAPTGVQAKAAPEGVQLNWDSSSNEPPKPGLSYLYRIFRQTEGEKKPEMVVGEIPAEAPEASFLDRNVEWEKNYSYRIAPITKVQVASGEPVEVEGDDSPAISVEAHDTFAPATPSGLQAVFSGVGQKPFVDLTWAPNMEPDLAGYNVYRHEAGAEPVKINAEPVPTPSFRDENVQAGHEYRYSVEAVDQRGNVSGRSEETSEKVP